MRSAKLIWVLRGISNELKNMPRTHIGDLFRTAREPLVLRVVLVDCLKDERSFRVFVFGLRSSLSSSKLVSVVKCAAAAGKRLLSVDRDLTLSKRRGIQVSKSQVPTFTLEFVF